jgi:2-amino-1-hydroxyethylphosphonate dioxygenase (glycine-forming)
MGSAVGQVLALLENSARAAYFGEAVTQLEHALQCADLAARAGADNELTVACLLHDVGHLIGVPAGEVGVPDHDDVGALFLRELGFSERLCALVGSHVDAKRYLTATDPAYGERLSPASVKTLALQGGPMTPAEAAAFAADPLLRDKLRLRSWDEQAKIPGAPVPALETYRSKIEEALQT